MKRWSLLVAAMLATGCARESASPTEQGAAPLECGAATTGVLQRLPKGDRELPTTNAAEFLSGFNGQIEAAKRMVENDPTSATKRVMLASLLAARGKLSGDLDEIQSGIDNLSRAVELAPNDPAPLIERANLQQSLHRFPAAHVDLEKARALGGPRDAIAAIQQELDWNEGHYDQAIAAIRRPPVRTMMTVMRQARLQHDLGDYPGADRLFADAEDLIDDTSPVPVAFLNFQRGFHAYEIGRIDEAIVFYSEALRRLPGWITAEEHLAEVLVMKGRTSEALPLYEDVVSRSKDPELAGALADLYAKLGREADADAYHARARAGFDRYLATYPEAAYGHGSAFFLGSGNDPKRGLAMREANVKLRPNAVVQAELAEARLVNGDIAGARAAIDKALAAPVKASTIAWTAARVFAAEGERARSNALASEACMLNPRSSLDEPPIDP